MTSGPEHYVAAEDCLSRYRELTAAVAAVPGHQVQSKHVELMQCVLAEAQVHATLAHAWATDRLRPKRRHTSDDASTGFYP